MSFLRLLNVKLMKNHSKTISFVKLSLSTDTTSEIVDNSQGGYAKAFKKFESLNEDNNIPEKYTFDSLLRTSKFIDLGDPQGKVVQGRVFHVVEDDLYIDFGWKFHCVCPRPNKNSSEYVRGAKVRLLVKDLELSSKFLGFKKDLTLLEADCILLGLIIQDRNSQKT